MVEYDNVSVGNVEQVRRIIHIIVTLHDGHFLEVFHGIERSVTEQPAGIRFCAGYAEARQKFVHGIRYGEAVRYLFLLPFPIRILHLAHVTVYTETCQRFQGDVGKAVFVSMKVGTLQQNRFRKDVAYFQIDAYGGIWLRL